ncbi:hypothetical protein J2X42_001821 [Arthrobacter sp. BE255]|nr:hypothetical protein [Arthrobacter sp. BE255]
MDIGQQVEAFSASTAPHSGAAAGISATRFVAGLARTIL